MTSQKLADSKITIALIAAASMILAVGAHEHLGHSLACVAQGGRLNSIGAFYVDCERTSLSMNAYKLVALAGPLISLTSGLLLHYLLRKKSFASDGLKFALWHLATASTFIGIGYLMFSGASGIGDLGDSKDGALYGTSGAMAIRIAMFIVGSVSYFLFAKYAAGVFSRLFGSSGNDGIRRAQKISVLAYASGIVASGIIGAFNPEGMIIVLISVLPTSVGSMSALMWMMQLIDRNPKIKIAESIVGYNKPWMVAGVVWMLFYAILFARTIHF